MASQTSLVLLLLCVMAVAASAGQWHSAGTNGWQEGNEMNWLNINRGDTVEWDYNPEQHNLCEVSYEAYQNCDTSTSPWAKYYTGNDKITFWNPGTYYYMCFYPEHCINGMKIAINVS